MKVLPVPPYTFVDDELLDPTLSNENLQGLLDAEAEASSRRYGRSILPIRFMTDIGTGYTQATTAEVRSFRLMFQHGMTIERAFFAYLGSGANISINLTEVSSGLAPAGVTNPWLTVVDGSVERTDQNNTQVSLVAMTHYKLQITADAAFDADKAEVILHLLADRFQDTTGVDGYADPAPIYLSEQDTVDAAAFLAHAASGLVPCTANLASGVVACYKPTLLSIEGLTSALAANNRRWDVPRSSSARRKANIAGVVIYVDMGAGTGAALQTVTWSILTALGATVSSFTVPVAGVTGLTSYEAHNLTIAMSVADLDAASNAGFDWSFSVATNGATTIAKTYAYFLWE